VIRIYRHDKHDAIGNLVAILGPAVKASHSQRLPIAFKRAATGWTCRWVIIHKKIQ
jgi:hypothetical protein